MNLNLRIVLRIVLGLILLLFGMDKLFGFLPMGTPAVDSFMNALIKTGYMMPLLGFSEVAIGVLLLMNKWKGFALVWLAPISVNMILFHLKFDITTIGPAVLVASINVYLIYQNRKRFLGLF